MLALSKGILSRTKLPGRYLAAELAAKIFAPTNKLVVGQISGFDYQFDFQDLLQRLMYFGLYEQAETTLIAGLLGEGDVFLDIGANIGYYSLTASRLVGEIGRVYAFEPIPENAQQILSAVQFNDIRNIYVNQSAVGESAGELVLHLGERKLGNSGGASIVPSNRKPVELIVRRLSIDTYLADEDVQSVRLVKIDVEGSEPDVIAGMKSLLSGANAPEILCEVNPWYLDMRGLDSTAITLTLADQGYRLFPIDRKAQPEIDPLKIVTQLTNIFCTKRGHSSWPI